MFNLFQFKLIIMSYDNISWEEALKESHETLLTTHPRSPKKLIPPHQWIKETLRKNLGSGYEFYAAGEGNGRYDREYKVPGLFYDKMVDITVIKNGKVKGAVSFKFVASNYSQNSNNYFENLVGECFNIQAMDIPFCHVFVIRDKIPYYNRDRKVQKYEQFTQHNLDKYLKLNRFNDKGAPSKLSMSIIHITGDEYKGDIIHPESFKELDTATKTKILENIDVQVSEYKEYSSSVANELKSMEVNKVLKEFADLIR